MTSPRTLLLLAGLLVACSKPLPPAPPPKRTVEGPPRRDLGPLVPLGYVGDHVGFTTTPVQPDGELDYGLRVRLSGDVRALVLHSSDPAGAPAGLEVWDTMLAPDKFPPEWHLPFPAADTYALAVVDSNQRVLNPKTVLEKRLFDDETVTIFVADQGHLRFGSGRSYTLLVLRTDGTVDRATTTLL